MWDVQTIGYGRGAKIDELVAEAETSMDEPLETGCGRLTVVEDGVDSRHRYVREKAGRVFAVV